MGDITFLRILVIIAFSWNTIFPWWVWLWAIIVELDHMANAYTDYRTNSLMLKEVEDGNKEISHPGDNPSTPV